MAETLKSLAVKSVDLVGYKLPCPIHPMKYKIFIPAIQAWNKTLTVSSPWLAHSDR